VKTVSLLLLSVLLVVSDGCRSPQQVDSDSGVDTGSRPDLPPEVDPGRWEGLVINEVAPKGVPADWFELFNTGLKPIPLDGFSVSDDSGDRSDAVPFPSGLVVPAGDRLLLQFDDDWPGFGLGVDEELSILAPDGTVIDSTGWLSIAAVPGRSWGRVPDGTGSFLVMDCPSPGRENTEATCEASLPSDILFQKTAVVEVELTLPVESVTSLNLDGSRWVDSKVRLRVGDFDSGTLDAGVRLKGRWGSAQTLDGKAAFKIKFDHSVADQDVLGMEDLTLNNMVQDCTMLHEHLSYELFRAFDIPVPRTGWAVVSVNGEPYGVYLLLEKYDRRFFNRFYPDTAHVFEGAYGSDVLPGQERYFEIKDGDSADVSDLSALASAVAEPDDRKWQARLSGVAAVDEMMRVWAVEQYIGHWDGYAPTINNFFLRCDSNGIFTLHPWGLDQTWGDFRDYHSGSGAIFARCMEIPECRARYDKVMLDLLNVVEQLDVIRMAEALDRFIESYRTADRRRICMEDQGHLEWTMWFIAARQRDARMRVPCFVDSTTDQDDDGYRCEEDCDDLNEKINPGVDDACFDWIDQDCSGLHDDGPGCPDCRAIWRGPHRYAYCTVKRSVADAVSACRDAGLALVNLNSESEQDWLLAQMPPVGMRSFWTGLEKIDGVFVWADGSQPGWTSWAPGEPSECGECSCSILDDSGAWLAVDCAAEHNVLCEAACADPGDSDGDGFGACADDCDDGNRDIHPGAVDVCGDWVDQDCDGMTDGLPECYGAFDVPVDSAIARGDRFVLHVFQAEFETARILCGKYGPEAGLAWFDEPGQEAAVAEIVRAWLGPARFLIGLNDRNEEGRWLWLAGGSPAYSNWGPSQPDRGERADCVENGPDGFWNDIDCVQPRQFVCRVP